MECLLVSELTTSLFIHLARALPQMSSRFHRQYSAQEVFKELGEWGGVAMWVCAVHLVGLSAL